MRYNSITLKIILCVTIFFFLTSITVLAIVDIRLRSISDAAQHSIYTERLNLITSRLESYQQRLEKTGRADLYKQDFQRLAISRVKENYYQDKDIEVYPVILDINGKILLTQDSTLTQNLLTASNNLNSENSDTDLSFHLKLANKEYWIISKYFPDWQWHIAYIVPLSIKYQNASVLHKTLLIILCSCTLFSLILLIFLLSRITKPIIHLTNIAGSIADGNLQQEITVSTNDEVGRLAKAFDKMRLSIQHQLNILNIEVADRKQAENNLLVTLNSIGDAVISTDNSGKITHMNPVAQKLTGWKFFEAIGKPLLEVFNIISSVTKQQCPSPVDQVLRTGEIVSLANHVVLQAKDGNEYQIADSGAPIKNDAGEVLGVVLVFRDVTDQYKLEAQLRQSDKMQAIGQLAGGIAHDFNNMLGGIIGAADLLGNHLDNTQQARELQSIIINASDRAAELTTQLLAFARSKKISSTTISLHQVIQDSLSLLTRTIDKSTRLIPEFNAKNDLIVGDPAQLQNIILNLGINASHAMPEGGVLQLSTRNLYLEEEYCSSSSFEINAGNYIELRVSDTGCGISAENLSHIFEPFFTTKSEGKGTGLGLSAVYGSIIQHHGSITIESQENQGTTFYILLPLSPDTKPTPYTDAMPETVGEGTILVVDDESLMLKTAEAILTDAGFSVILASNGQEGLEQYKAHMENIDLTILDMVMPVMNGKECLKHILQLNPEARVILASGFSKREDLEIIHNHDLCSFIAKPYRSQKLLQTIAKILNNVES